MSAKAESSVRELLQLGQIGLEQGYWKQAETYFDRVLARAPGHPVALLGKAKACRDPQQSLGLVRQALQSRPASLEALRLRTQFLRELQKVATDDRHDRGDSPDDLEDSRSDPAPTTGKHHAANGRTVRPAVSQERSVRRWISSLTRNLRGQGRLVVGCIAANIIVVLVVVTMMTFGGSPVRRDEPTSDLALQRLSSPLTTPAIELTTSSPTPALSVFVLAERTIALIFAPDLLSGSMSRGSGSVVTPEGLVLTNYHVVANRQQTALANSDGLAFVGFAVDVRRAPSEWYIAAVVASDPVRDLAVLRILYTSEGEPIGRGHFQAIPVGDSNSLTLGQSLVGLGYPELGGDTLTLTRGSMAGFAQNEAGVQLGKTDSELLPGSSGGAVLDEQGYLVGVITAAHADYRTQGRLSYFLLFEQARDLVNQAQRAPRPRPQIEWAVKALESMTR